MAAYPPLVLVAARQRQLAATDTLLAALSGPVQIVQAGLNLGLGSGAVGSITSGQGNLGVGEGALGRVSSGGDNVGLGFQTLPNCTTGSNNLAIGFQACFSLITGQYNIAMGLGALYHNVAGLFNVGIGLQALFSATGDGNFALGFSSGQTVGAGQYNVLLGTSTDVATAATEYGVAIGTYAVCASYEVAFGPVLSVQTGYGYSSTQSRPRADFTDSWVNSTDATRKARRVFAAWDTVAREGFRIEASGTGPQIGFLGASAVSRATVTGSRGGNAALASLLTALASLGLITDSSTA